MDETKERKRWAVTYTKQLKQKRKTYHDGFLQLNPSTNKVLLYDECEQLLECRLLKKDEVISSGETLTFNTYLVDIGDPDPATQGGSKPIPELNLQGRDKKVARKSGLLRREFRTGGSGVSTGDEKASTDNRGDERKCLSPSQRIIREFRKREIHKYMIPKSSPDSTKMSMTEWHVLYTSQLTQKTKKYHDGLLQMTTTGSFGRQIMLFDEGKKLLESRFLKKAEIIRSGESITFDAYLVEVGELKVNHGPHTDIVAKKESVNKENRLPNNETVEREWKVLYTPHVTQKAKRYYEGFLKLVMSGSIRKKVLLYDAGRRVLGSRFLKQDEAIKSGDSLAFDAHLVDVGESKGNPELILKPNVQREHSEIVGKAGVTSSQREFLKASNSLLKGNYGACAEGEGISNSGFCAVAERSFIDKAMTNRPLHQEKDTASNTGFCLVDQKSSVDKAMANKALRSAHQILSFLQKPMNQKKVDFPSIDTTLTSEVLETSLKDISGDNQLASSMPYQVSNKDMDVEKSTEIMDSEEPLEMNPRASSINDGNQYIKNAVTGISHQPQSSNNKGIAEVLACRISSSCVSISHERKGSRENNNVTEVDRFPSFDLGF